MCHEVTTVCDLLSPTLSLDVSMASILPTTPVLSTASVLPTSECIINALTSSVLEPSIIASMIVEGK